MKKLAKILTAAVTASLMLIVMCIGVSAEGIFDNAVTIKSGKINEVEIKNYGDEFVYKINVAKSGEMSIAMSAEIKQATFRVFDSDYNEVELTDNVTTGKYFTMGSVDRIEYNSSSKIFKGTFTCQVKKGTYYFYFGRESYNGTVKFTVKVPGGNKEYVSCPVIELKKGDTISVGAMISNKTSSKITLETSDSKVAKYDYDNVVTAVSKGTAIITIKSGSETFRLAIVVK